MTATDMLLHSKYGAHISSKKKDNAMNDFARSSTTFTYSASPTTYKRALPEGILVTNDFVSFLKFPFFLIETLAFLLLDS